jgi:uncharacterized protein (TIGR02117 family)
VIARWFGLLLLVLVACTAALPPDDGPRTETIHVVIREWHTDIGLPAEVVRGRLSPLRDTFPGADWFVFGIGERSFIVNPDAGVLDMLTALFPSPTAMLVTGLRQSPAAAFAASGEIITLRVTPAGLARLVAFIEAAFEYAGSEYAGSAGPRLLSPGPYAGSLFYYATPTYSGLYTCNTWTADALRAAGIPIQSSITLFASDVARQIRQ